MIDWTQKGNIATEEAIKIKKKKTQEIHSEMETVIGELSPAESMFLMLQYAMLKMNTDASDDPTGTHLTPTGEDIVTWGDKIASGLEAKIVELRAL